MGKQDGWTRTPNKVYEAMAGMCEAELRVTMVVVRMTYGFQRERADLQYEDFMIHGGLKSKASIAKGVKLMLRRGLFAKGQTRSEFVIAGAKSSLSEPIAPEESSPSEPIDDFDTEKSSLNEPKKSSLNEPFQLNKERKKGEEINPFPFQPSPKSDAPEHRGPADKRIDAIMAVCGYDPTIERQLRKAESAAAQLRSYSAGSILDRYRLVDIPPETWYWYRDDWRGRKGQRPTPDGILETISLERIPESAVNSRASPDVTDNGRSPTNSASARIRAQIQQEMEAANNSG